MNNLLVLRTFDSKATAMSCCCSEVEDLFQEEHNLPSVHFSRREIIASLHTITKHVVNCVVIGSSNLRVYTYIRVYICGLTRTL